MIFDPTKPTDLPPPSVSVDTIRTNFSSYADVFDNNHIALNLSNEGKHNQVILQQQFGNPVVNGNFADLFSKIISAQSGNSQELHAMIPRFLPNDFAYQPQQLTFNIVNTVGPNQYQSFIAGGYIVYFGKVTQGPGSAVSLSVALSPTPSQVVCVIANSTTVINSSTFFYQPVAVNNVSTAGFNVNPSGSNPGPGGQDFYWICIAKQ